LNEGSSEEFEDTKGVIRIRKSKKNRQYNGQKKVQKDKQRSIQHSPQDTEQRQTNQKTQHEQMKG
jgi:hypothetical protein